MHLPIQTTIILLPADAEVVAVVVGHVVGVKNGWVQQSKGENRGANGSLVLIDVHDHPITHPHCRVIGVGAAGTPAGWGCNTQ